MGTLGGWSKRQKLTINHNKIDDELTDFPVKVIIPSDNPLFYTAKNDGSDVRFTAADGETLLKFEREVHDTTEKIAVYHVKIPSVSSTNDTDFYMYYGNADASDASSTNDVWDSYYKLVMHMGPSLEDSTSNGNDGINYGTTLGLNNDGYYRSFDGVNDYIGDIVLSDMSQYTMTAYCDANLALSDSRSVVGGRTSNTGYFSNIAFRQSTGELYSYRSGKDSSLVTGYTNTTEKQVFVMRQDLSEHSLWAKGDKKGTRSSHIGYSALEFVIGRGYSGRYYNGIIFEVRVSSTARSDAWIKATSASLHNNLLTFGSEEPAVTMMLAFNF